MDAALEYLWDDYRKWLDKYVSKEKRVRIIFVVALSGVFISGFLAWKDEFQRAENLQATLNIKPPADFERLLKEAEARADRLQENLELARQVSEKQGKELEIARKDLKQLQVRFAPRHITEKQKIALVKRLRGQSEDRVVTVKTVDGAGPESFVYAEDFISVLSAARWKVKFHGHWYLLIEDVAIRSRRNDMVAVFMKHQFEELGIKMKHIETNEVAENNIDIVIGPRS